MSWRSRPKRSIFHTRGAVEAPLLRVSQHPLELVTADDALARDVPVCIYFYDVNAVLLSILLAVGNLALNGLLRLVRAW